jgi:hypothetical protein
VSRLAQAVREDDGETVMILGGEHGAVTLHVSLCGVPQQEILHSPREFPGWAGPLPCRYMEMQCWWLCSVLLVQHALGRGTAEEMLWQMMEHSYRLYLAGERRPS